jgi:aminoglycoside phosphotransferase (APT) family kinase protein
MTRYWRSGIPAEAAPVRGERRPTEYREGVTRTPAFLAAVASCAVPGLDAVAVRAARDVPGNRNDVGFVTDTQRRAWVVRVPTTPAVGAQLDTAADLLLLLHRRVPFSVPLPRGFLAIPEGRAVVYPYLHGRSVLLGSVMPGPGIAAEIGRAIASLHNVDRAVFEEAGVPVYDAETCRIRHLADLDRGAATGHVPTALLSRWERALEDVSAWRFAPTPVHADLTGGRFLVTFSDEENPETASVRAVTGWEHAKVADPADDFAVLATECSEEAFESIVEAYSVARVERPDRHLRHRTKLVAELRLLTQLLDAVNAAEPPLITRRAAELRALDERTADEPELVVTEPEPAAVAPPTISAAVLETVEAGDVDAEVGEDDTQLLKTGAAADATAVIPPEELERLRGKPVPEPETSTENNGESWYEVLEPAALVEETMTTTDLVSEEDIQNRGDEAVEAEASPEAESERSEEPEPTEPQPAAPDAAAEPRTAPPEAEPPPAPRPPKPRNATTRKRTRPRTTRRRS